SQVLGLLESQTLQNLSLITLIEKQIAGFNRTLAREVVLRAGIEKGTLDKIESAAIDRLVSEVKTIASGFDSNDTLGYLYDIQGELEAYPFKLKSADQEPEKYKSLSLAIVKMIGRRQQTKVDTDDSRSITM